MDSPQADRFGDMSNIDLIGEARVRVDGDCAVREPLARHVVTASPSCPRVDSLEELFPLFGSTLVVVPPFEDSKVHEVALCVDVPGSHVVVMVNRASGDFLDPTEVGDGGDESLVCGRQLASYLAAVASTSRVVATLGVVHGGASVCDCALGGSKDSSIQFKLGGSKGERSFEPVDFQFTGTVAPLGSITAALGSSGSDDRQRLDLASWLTGNLDSMEMGFADELAKSSGRWVALDYGRRRVVADADSKSSLLAQLNVENVRGAVILEVPLPDAPSRVGLG